MILNSHNYIKACRICLVFPKNEERINIYEAKLPECDISYYEALVSLAFEFGSVGEKPDSICNICAGQVNSSINFKRIVENSVHIIELLKSKKEPENSFSINSVNDEDLSTEDAESLTINETETIFYVPSKNSSVEVESADEETEEDGLDAVNFIINDVAKKRNEEKAAKLKKKKEEEKLKKDNPETIEYANRKHACEVCEKRFLKRSNLIDHLRIHAASKIFQCDYCDKAFFQAGNFKTHLRTHTGEKPFQCNICQKSYTQSSALKIHVRSHTREKNYICTVCSKAFTNGSDLAKHKNIHDLEKRFKCEFCSKSFAQKIHLRKHVNNHHLKTAIPVVSEGKASSSTRP